METATATSYWCHMCSQTVNPIVDVEIKCPFCRSGFVEEMVNGSGGGASSDNNELESEFGSERALSLWAPILLGMMGNPRGRRSRFRHLEFDEDDDDNDNGAGEGHRLAEHTELDRELDSVLRRRRNSATILQLLQGIRAGMTTESENYEGERNRELDRDRERVILINPINQTIVVQGGGGQTDNQNQSIGSLGDYFVGPGLDLLLQHLAENDPNRYGTPPAQKEAVDDLPVVRVEGSLQCSVCLDDFEVDAEAKEMPCKHKFHTGCILPWLELHSSCPVCRHQLPADESKRDVDGGESARFMDDLNVNVNGGGSGEIEDERNNASGRRFSFPWPFYGLFSSQGGAGNSSGGGSTSDSQRDETSI